MFGKACVIIVHDIKDILLVLVNFSKEGRFIVDLKTMTIAFTVSSKMLS